MRTICLGISILFICLIFDKGGRMIKKYDYPQLTDQKIG